MDNKISPGTLSRLLRGARSGAEATAAMTAAFAAFDAFGWLGQLPPRQVVDRLLPNASERTARVATMVSHTSYGALFGAGFAFLPRRRPVLVGVLFGLLVCAANYEALLPGLRIRQPLHRDQRREIIAMLVAHIVYGAGLQQRLARRESAADQHSDQHS